jgi:hypothetical protein
MNQSPSPMFKWPASKNSDPSTSKIADEKITQSGKRESRAYYWAKQVQEFPELTSSELAAITSGDRYECAKRLTDARNLKLVRNGERRLCKVTNNLAMTWETR